MTTRRITAHVALGSLCACIAVAGCASDGAPSVTFATAPTTTAAGAVTTSTVVSTTAEATTTTTSTLPLAAAVVSYETVATGFSRPLDLAWRPGDVAIYVVQKRGQVIPVVDGVAGPAVLDLAGTVSTENERGLLGLEFHPTRDLAYVNYTDRNGDTRVVEYRVSDDPTTGRAAFDSGSARVLMTIAQPYDNHNGGDLAIAADGTLLIATGDGGSGGDPQRNALDVRSLLGKILRIDPAPAGDQPYTVPPDNPFVAVEGARPELWSVGLRNPWRIDIDPSTGDLWVPDVGQREWEEVNVVVAGAARLGGGGVNFGWSAFEATHPFNPDQPTEGATPPVHEYAHGDDGCSVTGGALARGTAVPSLAGWFVFSDFCSGRVWALRVGPGGTEVVRIDPGVDGGSTLGAVSTVRRDPNGDLWLLVYDAGRLVRLTGT